MAKIKPLSEIKTFLTPIGESVGVRVVDVEWKGNALTVYIDKDGGVDLDTCEKFHRAIDAPLDELDPTFGAAYTLNCSSLGLDRPFRTEEDFASHVGTEVEVRLYQAVKGKKYLEGVLKDARPTSVVIETFDGQTLSLEKKSISKMNVLIRVE